MKPILPDLVAHCFMDEEQFAQPMDFVYSFSGNGLM